MNLFKNMTFIVTLLVSLLLATGCSDDNVLDNQQSKFGYLQLKVRKQIQTYALTGGAELENLKDAKKIQIDLLYNNKQLTQTLNVSASSDAAAELGLTSETIQLLPGTYTLTGYKIYGEYVAGVTEGNSAPILQEGEPEEALSFDIVASQLKVLPVEVVAQRRGYLSLILDKDFSNIQPQTKAAGYDPESFVYDNISRVQVDLRTGVAGAIRQYEFKTRRGNNDYLYHTDTLNIRVNDYSMVQMRLYDKYNKLIMVVDPMQKISITDEKLTRESVSIDMPLTPAFRDYIALYNIWKAMDGENWYWVGNGFNTGANFLFTYSDGTPRPLDLWGAQPGVVLNGQGRIASLNLGGFNAKGMVPDAIGELTALTTLYLGNHSDQGLIDPEEGMVSLDRFVLEMQGVDVKANRMEIAKEQMRLRHPKTTTSLTTLSQKEKPFKYAIAGSPALENPSNRITGISDAIGKCKELSYLSVANGLVKELPASLATLENLTDLEIYKCPMTEFPACVLEMKHLVAFNFSGNSRVNSTDITAALERFFDGEAQNTMQLLYLTDNGLEQLPANLANMSGLTLLDVANNRLTSVPFLGKEVAYIQCFLDHNRLTEIPEGWFHTDDLEKISFHNNQLTTFPNMFNAQSVYQIEEVDLSGNHISKMPANFKGIHAEVLNLNENRFEEFPVEFSESASIFNFLRISNNRIQTISEEAIANLKQLKALECTGNKLSALPATFDVIRFPNMTAVDISYNQFAEFPFAVLNVQLLTELRISNQMNHDTGKKVLRKWPTGIDEHPALRVLDLSSNDLGNVAKFPTLLNMLNIQDNPNIYITVPQDILYRMINGTFVLYFDKDQNVDGI
ncbi:MAG: DUF4458 domain-containing protein [Bacteroidales bacterium]